MKNTLADVHNHLMARLEELGDWELTGEALEDAVTRAKASVAVSNAITGNARVVLDAYQTESEAMGSRAGLAPRMLIGPRT